MRVVPYGEVLREAERLGLRCVYPNGAAFAPVNLWHVTGWVTGGDVTVRAEYRERVRRVGVEELPRLTAGAAFAGAGPVWLAPVHHWAAELDHGTDADGLNVSQVLADVGVDAGALSGVRRADALEFRDAEVLCGLLGGLWPLLWKTDFALLSPGRAWVATVHHHRQAWWRSADAGHAEALLGLAGGTSGVEAGCASRVHVEATGKGGEGSSTGG